MTNNVRITKVNTFLGFAVCRPLFEDRRYTGLLQTETFASYFTERVARFYLLYSNKYMSCLCRKLTICNLCLAGLL